MDEYRYPNGNKRHAPLLRIPIQSEWTSSINPSAFVVVPAMIGAINLEGGIGTTRGLRGLVPPLKEEGEDDGSLPPLSMVGESLRAASRTRFA